MSFLDIGHVHLNLKFFFSRNTSELKYKILDTDALFLQEDMWIAFREVRRGSLLIKWNKKIGYAD